MEGFSLPVESLKGLAHLGVMIEKHYRKPQDIEWAWTKDKSGRRGRFFILQARPVTALREPVKIKGPMRMVIPMLTEMWPVRPYPLDVTTYTGAVEKAIGNLLVVLIGKSAPDPDKTLLVEDGVPVCYLPPEFRFSFSILYKPLLTFWHTRHNDPASKH